MGAQGKSIKLTIVYCPSQPITKFGFSFYTWNPSARARQPMASSRVVSVMRYLFFPSHSSPVIISFLIQPPIPNTNNELVYFGLVADQAGQNRINSFINPQSGLIHFDANPII